MTNVIVVEDDSTFLRVVERELKKEGMSVRCTVDVQEAIHWLGQFDIDVLLTDLRMNDLDGLDLMRRAHDLSPSTRTILMSGMASAKDYDTAVELGAVRVLCKPFSNSDLRDAVRQAAECDIGFRGSVHGLGLIDILQMFHFANRSLVLVVDAGCKGRLFLERGAIVHAEHGKLDGEEALKKLLALPRGVLRTESFNEPPRRTIQREFQLLLLDSLRALDESPLSGPPPLLLVRSSLPAPDPALPDPCVTPLKAASLPQGVSLVPPPVPSVDTAGQARACAGSLSARFATALRFLPHRPLTLLGIGMYLSNHNTECLLGDVDPELFMQPTWELLDAAMRMSDSPTGIVERVSPGTVVCAIWDRPSDMGILIADGFRLASEAAFLRASIQTFARRFLEINE